MSKKESAGKEPNTSPTSQPSGNGIQMLVLVGFIVLGVIGVRAASKKASSAKKPWRPIVNIKFQTDEQLALTPPQGKSAVNEMLRKRQAKAKALPKKPSNWVLLGHAWVRKARTTSQEIYYKNAEACARKALKIDPQYGMALNLKSLVHLQKHEFKKARNVARQILKRRRGDVMAWGNLSDAFLELGEYKQCEVAAQVMMNLKPSLPSYVRAAYLLWLRGQFYEARTAIKHAYDAGRGQKDREPVAWVLTQGAKFHWHEGDLDGAGAGYDVAFRYKSGFPPAVVGKARVALARGRAKLAAELLGDAFKARPLAATAWLLGDARAAAGDKAGAAKAYKLVERIGKREDYRTLALFYATKKQKLADALLYAGREYLKRQDIYTEDAYAWALFRNGQIKDAAIHAKNANRLGTRDASLWFHAGAIMAAAGQKKAGLLLVQKALSLNPHFDETAAPEAKAMLKAAGLPIPKPGSLTRLKPPKAGVLDPDKKALPKNFQVLRDPKAKRHKVGKIILPRRSAPPKPAPKAATRPIVPRPRAVVPSPRAVTPRARVAPTPRVVAKPASRPTKRR